MADAALTLPSYGKINWSLTILGIREDGLHEIETVLQTISLHDTLIFEESSDLHLEVGPASTDVPRDDTNLVLRAARALRDVTKVERGALIRLHKRIPTGAGLGGGSSNAAMTLLGLCQLWGVKAQKKELERIAETLGADVPFFLFGGTAVGRGTGGEIEPLDDFPHSKLLIVYPGFKISTSDAYSAWDASLTKERRATNLAISRARANVNSGPGFSVHNDFEQVVIPLMAGIGRAKDRLLENRARTVLLAGSGSSVFGIFDNTKAQEQARKVLELESGWQVFACSTLTRTEYLEALGHCAVLI